jgi:hypothetical protein
MVLHVLLAYDAPNADPLVRVSFRAKLHDKGWNTLWPSFTLERSFASDLAERTKLIDERFANDPKTPDYDPHECADDWFGVASNRREIETLVRDDVTAAARDVGLRSFSYVLQVGTDLPTGDSVSLP